jgi:iron-sulfur cluster insertion protein
MNTADTATETGTAPGAITISDSAIKRVRALTAEGEYAGMKLRVSVSGGGCSGFQYGFSFDDAQNGDDRVVERDGISVLIDEMSWDFLAGGKIDFVEELIGSYFTVQNPNAASTCGCGTSFSIG